LGTKTGNRRWIDWDDDRLLDGSQFRPDPIERRFPEIFSRPEVQLNLIQQNNVTENNLTLSITLEEVRAIEAQAEPVRERVKEMFEAYRPNQGNGDADTGSSISMAVQEKFANYRPGTPML
jgi:hypothetical protein